MKFGSMSWPELSAVAGNASIVVELIQFLLSGGFRRIVLLNSHGGNIAPVRLALPQLALSSPPSNVALATCWEIAGKAFAGESPMESPALSHACEYESNLRLHPHPSLVRMECAARAERAAANAWIGWEDEVAECLSSNGSSGDPQLGTAAKGAHLFAKALDALEAFVHNFHSWPMPEDLRHA